MILFALSLFLRRRSRKNNRWLPHRHRRFGFFFRNLHVDRVLRHPDNLRDRRFGRFDRVLRAVSLRGIALAAVRVHHPDPVGLMAQFVLECVRPLGLPEPAGDVEALRLVDGFVCSLAGELVADPVGLRLSFEFLRGLFVRHRHHFTYAGLFPTVYSSPPCRCSFATFVAPT